MRTLLLFPPQAHFTQPYLALPSLTAYLKANGFPDTHQRDLNLESLEYFFSPARLALARDRVRERLAAFPSEQPLPLAEMDRFRALAEADLAADSVVDGITDAIAVMRDPERFYDYDEYLKAVKRIDRAFKLVSAEWYPTVLSPNSFSMRWSIEREPEVLEAIFDTSENLYAEFYAEKVIPEIVAAKPDLIGISITYGSMIIPAFSLARMIKEKLPGVHITIGGGLLAYAGAKVAKSGKVFDVIDSVVMLEGEGPLLGIAQALRDGAPLDDVGNLVWRKDGVVVTNKSVAPLEIDSLPTPDFEGMPFDRYFSPHIALPLAITRGCYYEKCVFCTLYKVIGPGYRQRNIEKILDDIESVTARWNSKYVYFVVEDMPPVLFRALPAALARRKLEILWWTDARLERNLYTPELCRSLYEAGCRRIALGFESASQRVLDLMEKGTAINEAEGILTNITNAGIAVVLYTMIGFPTETADEALQTLDWIQSHRHLIQEVSLRIFYIDLLSTVYAQPERFQITKIHHDKTKEYQVYYDHDCSVGMSRAGAREVFFQFMEVVRKEFPLFQGDNLWLFELKSHHFLWLCREGTLDLFQGRTVPRVARSAPAVSSAAFENAKPRLADGVVLRDLPFDLMAVSRTLLDAEDRTLRPRYQSGSFKSEMIEQLGDEIPPIEPKSTPIVFRGESSDLLRIGKDAADILDALDGHTAIRDVLARFPESKRDKVRAFLASAFERGLAESTQKVSDGRRDRIAAGSTMQEDA